MRLEEMPLRLSSDERDFEMDDDETDYLLQPSEDSIRQLTSRRRRIADCSKYLKSCLCGIMYEEHLKIGIDRKELL